jgi:succinate dehydrogenase/fumarate reductase-like Fe-S protein
VRELLDVVPELLVELRQVHTIMNCVDVCPKGLNVMKAMGKIKELIVRCAVRC